MDLTRDDDNENLHGVPSLATTAICSHPFTESPFDLLRVLSSNRLAKADVTRYNEFKLLEVIRKFNHGKDNNHAEVYRCCLKYLENFNTADNTLNIATVLGQLATCIKHKQGSVFSFGKQNRISVQVYVAWWQYVVINWDSVDKNWCIQCFRGHFGWWMDKAFVEYRRSKGTDDTWSFVRNHLKTLFTRSNMVGVYDPNGQYARFDRGDDEFFLYYAPNQ